MPAIQGTSCFGDWRWWDRVSTLNNENKTAEETSIPSRLDDYLAIVCILDKIRLIAQKSL